jgi:3-phenylpropionate/trans-cinnamate dioxygenase ferredoxin reductase component
MSKIIIIGAGQAGGRLVQNLLANQNDNEIYLFGEEDYLPYERPPLSKSFLSGEKKIEDLYLAPSTNFKDKKLKIFQGNKIQKIDIERKHIIDSHNDAYTYDKIVFANGSSPKKINSNGVKNVFYLRDISDSQNIKSNLAISQNIVLLGAGFINLEIASTIRQKFPEKKISIIEFSSDILGRNSNTDIRKIIYKLHLNNNINFHFNTSIKKLIGNANIEKIILDNKDEIFCDMLVVGIGVKPNIDLLLNTSLFNEKGIEVNHYCETKISDLYAIGDISLFTSNFFSKKIREESYNNAEKQSFIVSQNITGNKIMYDEVPWFWTDQFKYNFQILGEINNYDKCIDRVYNDDKKIKFFIQNNKVRGAFAINNGRDIKITKKIIVNNFDIELSQLENVDINLKKMV